MSTYVGPEVRTWSQRWEPSPHQRVFYDQQYKYRSKPMRKTAPLPYFRKKCRSSVNGTPVFPNLCPVDCLNFGAGAWISYESRGPLNRCLQTAYGKLVGKVKEMEQGWGENLATRKQSLDMMIHRLGTLTVAARRLKRGDIRGFCNALGVTPRGEKSRLRKASSIWLEYHFGWEPLYGDIYTACNILSSDVPGGTIRGVGLERIAQATRRDQHSFKTTTGRVIAVLQGDYYVENPNKFLLNQMGVINPISIAWELVPFSFAVDWFIPVGQFLGGLTDFYGVHRSNEFTTKFVDVSCSEMSSGQGPVQSHGVMTERTLGISVPKPTFKLFRGFSVTRGATALALCVGALRSLG